MKRQQHMAGCVEGERPAPASAGLLPGGMPVSPPQRLGVQGQGSEQGTVPVCSLMWSKNQGVRGPRQGHSASPLCSRKATPSGHQRVPSPPRPKRDLTEVTKD